jgi:hypothetical protein
MKRSVVAALLLIAAISAAHAFGFGLGNRFGRLGASGQGGSVTPPPPLSNLRITNTGAFRITNTGANRAVSP